VACGEIYWSEEIYNILEYNPVARAKLDLAFQRIHPGDQDLVRQTLDDSTREKKDFDIEHRLLMPDGRVKHVHVIGRIVYTGNLDFVGAMTDVTAAKEAEEKIRQSEKEARQLLDLSPLHITELGPEGARLYTNRASLDYYGITLANGRTLICNRCCIRRTPGSWPINFPQNSKADRRLNTKCGSRERTDGFAGSTTA
jgi:PAS domain S-box-containing protein